MCKLCAAVWLLFPLFASASSPSPLDKIAQRLDRLEQENDALKRELADLRRELTAARQGASSTAVATNEGATVSTAPGVELQERMDIAERRIDEQAQSKVDAGQRYPIRFTGMLLANLYKNSKASAGVDNPTVTPRAAGRAAGGLTFRQSVIGAEYRGGQTFLGGQVKGSIFVDFYEGNTEVNSYPPVRIRTATVDVDWGSRSVMVGLEKPLFSQRDPTSFSFVGVSPLTSAGNLWRWQPQIRFEQRFKLGESTTFKAQAALLQTNEESSTNDARISVERRRPSLEGRFELAHAFDDTRKIAIAPGFHVSTTHALGQQLASNLVSVDWLASPFSKLQLTGLFWSGQNIHHFGSMRQGIILMPDGRLVAVQSKGGWAQASVPFTSRVSLNLFSGIHDDRNRDLTVTGIGANRLGGANVMFRLAPNVLLSLEALQIRTDYLNSGQRKNNRYDLSVVYLF